MRIFRSTLVAVAATVVAACGDKVNVQAPVNTTTTVTATSTATATATPKVNSVTVTPATATLTVGQTITLTAAVNADAGLATTVTWASSDTTLAKVGSTTGIVTAVKATAGVSICATSTVDSGKKGCGSVVVTAASATVPATASIAGVFQTNLTIPVNPASVTGTIFAQVNINPGTQVVQRVVLIVGSVRADSQVFSAAQSAALRYAADQAGVSKDVSQPTVVLTANTAAYNATTGAATYTNAAGQSIKVELWVAGATTASSTAAYASTITLNNSDAVYGTWTYPSTVKSATDVLGYSWTGFGGGVATLKVTPVSYAGKTASSVAVSYAVASAQTAAPATGGMATTNTYCGTAPLASSGSCLALPAGVDTALTKVVTGSAPYSVSLGLYDHEFIPGVSTGTNNNQIAGGLAPTVTVNYTDGSSIAAQAFTNATAVALRLDNKGPARPALSNPAFNASLASLRPQVSFAVAPTLNSLSVVADSGKTITAIPSDLGSSYVSGGATVAAPGGITFKAFRNAGGTGAGADTTAVYATEITGANLSGLSETGAYCFKVTAYDALGNASPAVADSWVNAAGAVVAKSCAKVSASGSGQISANVDGTAPVLAWTTTTGLNFSQVDTVWAGGTNVDYYFNKTDNSAVTLTAKIASVNNTGGVTTNGCVLKTYAAGACPTFVPKLNANGSYQMLDTTTGAAGLTTKTLSGNQYVITVTVVDAAGNTGTNLTRVLVADATVPSVTAPAALSTTLGSSLSISSYGNDNISVAKYAPILWAPLAAGLGTNFPIYAADFATWETLAGCCTKFLNQALTATAAASVAPTYLYPSSAAQSYFSATTQATYLTTWGMEVADQANNIATAGATSMTYVDTYTGWTLFSNFAGVTGGLDGAPSVLSAFATNLVPSGGGVYGTTVTSNATASGTFQQTVNAFARVGRNAALAYGSSYLADRAVCSDSRLSGAGENVVYYAADGTTITATPYSTTSFSTYKANPALHAAPTVTAFVQVSAAGQPGLMYVGTPSLISTNTSTGTAVSPCDDIVSRKYSYTFTPGALRALKPFTTGASAQMYFLYTFEKGQAVFGPAMTFTFTQ